MDIKHSVLWKLPRICETAWGWNGLWKATSIHKSHLGSDSREDGGIGRSRNLSLGQNDRTSRNGQKQQFWTQGLGQHLQHPGQSLRERPVDANWFPLSSSSSYLVPHTLNPHTHLHSQQGGTAIGVPSVACWDKVGETCPSKTGVGSAGWWLLLITERPAGCCFNHQELKWRPHQKGIETNRTYFFFPPWEADI